MSTLPMFAGDNRLEVLANAEFLDASAAKRGLRPTRMQCRWSFWMKRLGPSCASREAHRPIS